MLPKKQSTQSTDELRAEVTRLKAELKKKKKYGLVWEDKPEDVVEVCKEKLPVMKEVKMARRVVCSPVDNFWQLFRTSIFVLFLVYYA